MLLRLPVKNEQKLAKCGSWLAEHRAGNDLVDDPVKKEMMKTKNMKLV